VCEMSVTAAGTRVGLIKTSSISADIRGSGAPAGFYGFKMLRDPSDSKISETSTVLGFPFKGARMVIQLELQWSSLQVATLKSLCGTESREVTLPSLSADDSWTLCTTVPHNQRITLKSAVAAKTKAPDPSCQYAVSPLSPLAPCTCPREPHVLCVCVCVRGSCTCPGEPHVWCVCVCVCVRGSATRALMCPLIFALLCIIFFHGALHVAGILITFMRLTPTHVHVGCAASGERSEQGEESESLRTCHIKSCAHVRVHA